MLVLTANIINNNNNNNKNNNNNNNNNNNSNSNFYAHTCHCDPLVSPPKTSGASEGSFRAQQRGLPWGETVETWSQIDLLTFFFGARNPTPVFFPENTSMQRHRFWCRTCAGFMCIYAHPYIYTYNYPMNTLKRRLDAMWWFTHS